MASLTQFLLTVSVCVSLGSAVEQALPSCPDGLCPGLGKAFPIWEKNVKDSLTGGRTVLKDTSLTNCATVTAKTTNSREFRDSNSMKDFVTRTNTESALSGSYKTAMYSLQASVNLMTGSSSDMSSAFHSTHLDIVAITHVVDFKEDGTCLGGEENLDDNWLQSFNSLPLISADSAEYDSSWDPYVNFLKDKGSHVMVQQQFGSRLQQWESSESTSSDISELLRAKACAGVEGVAGVGGWSAQACSSYNSSQRQQAMAIASTSLHVIMGGTASTRAALTKEITPASLSEFIDSAPQGDAAVAYAFKPVWQILMSIYQQKCDVSGPSSDACKQLQRAYNLNAAYEGWMAFGCRRLYTSSLIPVQRMRVVPSTNPIQTYACHAGKYGCHADSDCSNGGAVGTVCYCYGPSCLAPGNIISGTDQHRPEIKKVYDGSAFSAGVNPSCYYPFLQGCRCDTAWNKGGGDADIWTQSLASSRQLIV